MARMVVRRACWLKAVSLSKVMDLRRAVLIRPNTATMTDMVSAAVFPTSLAASVMRDLRSWRTSTGRALADDEVALPMTSLGSGGDSLWPFMDGNAILDRNS